MLIAVDIRDLLPQKEPFVLVDQLLNCSETLTESRFQVPLNHPMVNEGKLCEGGLVENIAQTSAAGSGYHAQMKGTSPPRGFIAGIKNLVVKRLPQTGSALFTRVALQDRIMGYNLIRGEVFERDEIIATCEMKIYCPE